MTTHGAPVSREPLIEAQHLTRRFNVSGGLLRRGQRVHAVEDVSLSIAPGEIVGLVGESGCGKSTLGRTLLRLLEPSAGSILVDGQDILALSQRQLGPFRRQMQFIFQDPFSSLDPRMTVRQLLAEPLRIHRLCPRRDEPARLEAILAQVGMKATDLDRYSHEFSGGQCQRLVIARTLLMAPRFIVCDEPLSALDVSIQAQIINLLLDLRDQHGLSYLLISHDLEVVRFMSHRIAVMYLGRIVEEGPAKQIASRPSHPYTRALLSSVPIPDPARRGRRRLVLPGDPPSPLCPPRGCSFHPRCPRAKRGHCDVALPLLTPTSSDGTHHVACHFPDP